MVPDHAQCVLDGYTFTRGSGRRRYYPHMFTTGSLVSAGVLGAGSGSRCWFPCMDQYLSRCRFKTTVTCGAGLNVVCFGSRVSEEEFVDSSGDR